MYYVVFYLCMVALAHECPSGRSANAQHTPVAQQSSHEDQGVARKKGSPCGVAKRIPAGLFLMGSDSPEAHPEDGEGPTRNVSIANQFWIDTCEVTNADFRDFTRATKFRTDAELYGWSFVFEQLLPPETLAADPNGVQDANWWRAVNRAWWRQPEGKGSSLRDRWDHPVVHVSWRDAFYYCKWRGGRLPTEEEWEYAARGGLNGKTFPWGEELNPGGKHVMNVWQGHQIAGEKYHFKNTAEDGFLGTAPAASFPPNGYGLHDMTGNVWEWTATQFTGRRPPTMPREAPNRPDMCNAVDFRVKKGGSYMCHADYCNRYRCSARQGIENDSSTGNLGFRCAYDTAPSI
eukprot:TRINITY_DN4555_c0_g1_i1.p1 TRINITY_DN4555_c0_g1~~TRINITY_DN4555_c0_g1_i1.p1  ORF type:complete len:347 (+),score=34.07 TRINITY_DN4555_c0_g1_i1:786-1826(+)